LMADNLAINVVPEPGSFTLFGLGVAGMYCWRWRTKCPCKGAVGSVHSA
jgi:hypothetical protein